MSMYDGFEMGGSLSQWYSCPGNAKASFVVPMDQGSVGEKVRSKGEPTCRACQHASCAMASCRATHSDNDDRSGHAACSMLCSVCGQSCEGHGRGTPWSIGSDLVHPLDAARGEPLLRRLICAAVRVGAKFCLGKCCCRTA